jgi:hypothetical protein
VLAIPDGDGRRVFTFVRDVTPPRLVNYTIDMDTGADRDDDGGGDDDDDDDDDDGDDDGDEVVVVYDDDDDNGNGDDDDDDDDDDDNAELVRVGHAGVLELEFSEMVMASSFRADGLMLESLDHSCFYYLTQGRRVRTTTAMMVMMITLIKMIILMKKKKMMIL